MTPVEAGPVGAESRNRLIGTWHLLGKKHQAQVHPKTARNMRGNF